MSAVPGPARTFESVLIRQCAPTLAGLKPGSIFCVKFLDSESVQQKVQQWDKKLSPRGLSAQVLLKRPDSMLIYIYRKKHLEQILFQRDYQQFLRESGYSNANLDGLLAQLILRLRTRPEFPHEIGVFLGYPLEDVIGFIENHGQNFTCCGFWKSYSDPAEIQACFDRYRRCIHIYTILFEQGIPIERLAVSA